MRRWGRLAERRWAALEAAALLVITALAATARLWDLGAIGLRGDEAVYAGQAAVLAGDQELKRYFVLLSRGNSNFLLYQYVLAAAYWLFGVSDVLARVVAAVFSILTVPLTYAIGRTLFGRSTGLIAALLLAVSGYAIFLGRLALLDSTLTFCVTLAIYCGARWVRGGGDRWLYAFAAAAGLAVDAKVTGVLVLPVLGLALLLTHGYSRLTVRSVAISAVVFLICLAPAFYQLIEYGSLYLAFLADSIRRVSHVPWYYYPKVLARYDGYVLLVLAPVGLVVAAIRRSLGDILLATWILVFGVFQQAYPLKAFNYLLPLVPALALLGARALEQALSVVRRSWVAAPVALTIVLAASLPPVWSAVRVHDYAGMREAAYWLAENTAPDAGVMTLSQGSAQYVLAFYGRRDAYPFGRFRLATILPGGTVVRPSLRSDATPRDWVVLWPPRLLASGEVSYLVFYTNAGDDPPEDPIVRSSTQRQFQRLVEDYGGELVHTVYHNREPRVWIYEVTKRLPQPELTFSVERDVMRIEGRGFRLNAPVSLYYRGEFLAEMQADERGNFVTTVPVPATAGPVFYLVGVDSAGNYASTTGRHIWGDIAMEPDAGTTGDVETPALADQGQGAAARVGGE